MVCTWNIPFKLCGSWTCSWQSCFRGGWETEKEVSQGALAPSSCLPLPPRLISAPLLLFCHDIILHLKPKQWNQTDTSEMMTQNKSFLLKFCLSVFATLMKSLINTACTDKMLRFCFVFVSVGLGVWARKGCLQISKKKQLIAESIKHFGLKNKTTITA